MNKPKVTIWTDGAVSVHKTQQGGWCAILSIKMQQIGTTIYADSQKELSGVVPSPTKINRVELTAVLMGLKFLKRPCDVTIHTDSQNVIGWLYGFDLLTCAPEDRKWKRKDAECAKLCYEIDKVIEGGNHTVHWVKVKGHNGDPMNERCDLIANALSQGL